MLFLLSILERKMHVIEIIVTAIYDDPNLYNGNFKNQITKNILEKKVMYKIFLSNLVLLNLNFERNNLTVNIKSKTIIKGEIFSIIFLK